MAEIYIHIPGGEQLSIVPEASSSQDWALMGDNKLSLSFQRYECLILPAGAWCEFDGVIFYLLQEYKPTMIHSHLWQYNVAFVDGASWLGVTTALKTIDGEDAPLFTLTAPAIEHAAIIVSNLNRRLGSTVWKVGSVIDTPNITIEYTGKYCGAVLQEIVDDQNTEWWVDGTTLNIGRAEFGSLIELGYRDGLLGDITVTQADNMSSYRTLYPVGSTRNILPTEYGHDRLQLPNGQKSVMMNPAGVAELVEEAAFAGIYPRYKGKVTAVSTSIGQSNDGSQYLIYIVADTAIPFNPNDYEMPGLVKHITFQSGELMGAEFEVNYNPESNEFELITQFQENGSQLPGGMLIPQVGDEYVVWNISMPAEYYPLAEQELLEAAESFAAASTREANVYKVKLDYIDVQERGLSLRPGQKVRLHSLDYFPEQGYYDSRITRVTRPVNYPGEYTIDVSAVRVVGSLTRLQTSLAAATTKVNSLSNTVQTVVQTVDNAVKLTGNQRIAGEKNFVDGIRINGSPIIEYDPVINTWLFRGNVLAEGGFAAFSNIKGFKPSTITDAVLIDGRTIKRNADGLLCVDTSIIGGGGLDEDALEKYLDKYNYATTSDISSALNGYATESWVLSQKYLTGISSSMVTDALGYTPLSTSGGEIKADIASPLAISNANSAAIESGLEFKLSIFSKGWVGYNKSHGTILYTYTGSHYLGIKDNGVGHIDDNTILHSGNYSDYALPKSGGTVNGTLTLSDPNWCNQLFLKSQSSVVGMRFFINDNLVSYLYANADGVARWEDNNGVHSLLHSGNIGSYNAGSATKLQTPRTIWGKSFDGTEDIVGNLMLYKTSTTGGWSRQVYVAGVDGRTLGSIGLHGNGDSLDYVYIGTEYNNRWMSIYPTGDATFSGKVSVADMLYIYPDRGGYAGSHYIMDKTTGEAYHPSARGGEDKQFRLYYTPDQSTYVSLIDITKTGNVGIGTTAPSSKLHVNGDIRANGGHLDMDATNLGYVSIGLNRNSTYGGRLNPNYEAWQIQASPKNTFQILNESYGVVVDITQAGNVGIGTTSPSEKLHVHGNILATGGITAQNSSDERLKRNIRKFNASKVLMNLGGVWEYEYIDSEVESNHIYEGTHYGLIYQNVKGTALDAMCHEREDGMGALNYIHPKFISLIAGATMENISEVEKLKRKIRHLEQKVKQLENRA